MRASAAVVVILALWISGCATFVPPKSERYATPYRNPPASCPEACSKPCASFYISDEDLKKTGAAHFGVAGLLFPVVVPAGQQLAEKASLCLSDFFDLVSLNQDVRGAVAVRLSFLGFDVSAFTGKASLKIGITVMDSNGRELLGKEYSAEGGGHFPLYANELDQRRQIERTTEQAFAKAFDQLSEDLKQIRFDAFSGKVQ